MTRRRELVLVAAAFILILICHIARGVLAGAFVFMPVVAILLRGGAIAAKAIALHGPLMRRIGTLAGLGWPFVLTLLRWHIKPFVLMDCSVSQLRDNEHSMCPQVFEGNRLSIRGKATRLAKSRGRIATLRRISLRKISIRQEQKWNAIGAIVRRQ